MGTCTPEAVRDAQQAAERLNTRERDMSNVRALNEVAAEITSDWKKPYFGAVPYLEAMSQLSSVQSSYGYDSADSIVRYFLANAGTWRGETARRVKAELKGMLK